MCSMHSDLPLNPGVTASHLAPVKAKSIFLRRASGCFGTSRGLSRDSSSTTLPLAGLLSTTSPTPHVQVLRHVARLVTRLVVDYSAYAARPGASARRAALHAARCRLLRLHHTFGCLGTSRLDYFVYVARSGASARRTARHATHRRLLRVPRLRLAATLALLEPRRAS
jgi:hypothetical protein